MFAPHHDGASPFHHVLIPGGAGIAGDGVSGGGQWAGLSGEPAATVPYPSIGTHPGSAGGAGGSLSRMGTLPATPEGEEEATGMAAHGAEDAWQQQQLQRTAGGITSPWLTDAAVYREAASTQKQLQAAKEAAGMMGGHKMAAMLNMALSANRAKHGAAFAALGAGAACEQDDSKAPGDTVKRRTWQLPDSASPPVSLQPPSPAAAQQSGTATATNSWITAHDTAPSLSHNMPSPGQAPHNAATLPSETSPQASHAASTCGPHPASLAIYAQHPIASPRQPPLASNHSSKAACSLPSGMQPELSQVPSGPWSGFGQISSNAAQASPQARATGSGMVRMPRSEAWAKFLAYEGCIQICNSHSCEPAAQHFLSDSMKALRDGFNIGSLLLSATDLQDGQSQQADALPPGSGSEGGASKGPTERAMSRWKRGATKAIITNALTKSTGGLPPPAQLHRNDICWDDAEADEVQSPVQLPAGSGPNQAMHQRWAGAGAGYGPPPPGQLTLAAMGSNGGGMASPSHGGGMVGAAAATGPGSQLPGEPSLRVSVRYAKKQNGGLLGALVGWVPQSKGNTRGTALQLRMSCGGQVVSVPLDPKGYAPASSPSMLLPQSLAGMVSSGGAGDVPALSPRGGKELTVELVCASGPLAGGRIPMHKLWEHMEQAEDIEYVPPRGQGANARRGSTGGGQAGAAALVPEGTAMELALFSSSGEARKVGILELAILRVDAMPPAFVATRQLQGVGSGGGANNAPASPPSSTGSASGANGMVSYGWGMAQHEQVPAAAPGPASGGLPGAGAGAGPNPGRQPLRMSSCVAMDAMLEAALRGSGCGREQLLVGGPWRWLLQRFAATFDVSDAYVLIAHLRWILKPGVCSSTTHCFSTITLGLRPLLQKEREWQLTPNEVNLLVQIKRSIQALLQSAFERYTNLCDNSASNSTACGGAEGQSHASEPPASYTQLDNNRISPLQAAFELCDALRDTFASGAGPWLQSCFRTAAKLRWQALLSRSSCESGIDIAALLQVLSMADDLQAADAMRKLQRNAAAANHQRMMGGGGGGGGGIDQGPPGGVGGWRAGPGHMGPGAGHGAGTAGMQADMQRRMSNLSVLSGTSSQPRTSMQADVLYKGLEALSYSICQEVHYDLLLQACPGLIPEGLSLAHTTVEEYCGRFVEQLQLVLRECPPEEHSSQAVNLLVAVAEMQRYLELQGLLLDQRHPGHVSAMGLFRDHVCNWLRASQGVLLHICQQLEQQQEPASRGLPLAATFAGLDALPPPQLFDAAAVGSRLSALVTQMHSRCWGEMQGYARVMKHWARFGPDLEAAVCRVLRSVLEALKRKYPVPMPQPPAFLQQQQQQYLQGPPGGGGQAGGASFRAGPQGLGPQAEALRTWAEGQAGQVAGAMHRRTQSEMGTAAAAAIGAAAAARGPHGAAGKRGSAYMYSTNTPTMSPRGSEAGGAAAWQDAAYGVDVQGMQGLHGQMGWATGGVRGGGGWGVAAGPLSMEVLHSEAVLLNSLKYFMVLVPTLEWELEQWCAEGLGLGATGPNAQHASAAQSQHANATQAAAAARSLIGHQFDQFVKELRTEYSVAVTAVACRLFAALQQQPGASLPLALATPPPGGAYAAAGGAEAAEALSQHVAGALAALSSGLEAVMSALRGCVEPRVYVAVGRALWDLCGRELHEFVQGLNEGMVEAAWRARQRAEAALCLINDFFVQRLALDNSDSDMQAQDLSAPRNVDMVLRLLQRSTANANHAYTPF